MASFAASFSKSVTGTCTSLTVTDTSNYGFDNNDEHYVKADFTVREVTLRDVSGNIIAMQNIPTSSDSVTFNLTLLSLNQLYLDVALRLAGVGLSYEIRTGGLLPCIL